MEMLSSHSSLSPHSHLFPSLPSLSFIDPSPPPFLGRLPWVQLERRDLEQGHFPLPSSLDHGGGGCGGVIVIAMKKAAQQWPEIFSKAEFSPLPPPFFLLEVTFLSKLPPRLPRMEEESTNQPLAPRPVIFHRPQTPQEKYRCSCCNWQGNATAIYRHASAHHDGRASVEGG